MKLLKIVTILNLIILVSACSTKENKVVKEENINAKTTKVDTLLRNGNIVYNVKKDTVVGEAQISVTNKNIYEKYIYQDFFLNDSMMVRNFYPEMEAIIKITKDDNLIFEKSYFKKDFPAGSFSELLQNATIKDFKFTAFDSESKENIFTATLYIPNTDYENEFQLIISENGKSKFEYIDYESEN